MEFDSGFVPGRSADPLDAPGTHAERLAELGITSREQARRWTGEKPAVAVTAVTEIIGSPIPKDLKPAVSRLMGEAALAPQGAAAFLRDRLVANPEDEAAKLLLAGLNHINNQAA